MTKNAANSKHIYLWVGGSSLIGLLCGLFSYYLLGDHLGPSPIFKTVRQSYFGDDGYKFINPLLFADTPQSPHLNNLRSKVENLVSISVEENKADQISVYYKNLSTSEWFGINLDETYNPASMMKVAIMIAYLKYAEDRPLVLSETLFYDGTSDLNAQENFRSATTLSRGTYSIETLIERMIRYSDNNAATLLGEHLNRINFKLFNQPLLDLGIEEVSSDNDYMTVQNYAFFYRVLYNSTYLSRTMSEKALALLSRTDFKEGLVGAVPSSVLVSHKFGEFTVKNTQGHILKRELHDCGIVYATNPYLLCIMTKGENFENLKEIITQISKLINKEGDS